jgi:RIO kinase 2
MGPDADEPYFNIDDPDNEEDDEDNDQFATVPEDTDAAQEDSDLAVQPPQELTTTKLSALASEMTILDIRDTDPLPDLSDIKPEPQLTISTKAAKKKAGWAI